MISVTTQQSTDCSMMGAAIKELVCSVILVVHRRRRQSDDNDAMAATTANNNTSWMCNTPCIVPLCVSMGIHIILIRALPNGIHVLIW